MPNSLRLLQLFFLFVHLPLFVPKSEILDDSFEHTWMESSLLSLFVPLVPLEVLLHHQSDLESSLPPLRYFHNYLPRNVSFFINHYINAVNNSSKSFFVTLICFDVGRITKENAFICSRFKLSKLFIIILNIAFSSKNFEMLY